MEEEEEDKSSSRRWNNPKQQQPHVVVLPFPAQGHLNPMMQLAKLLHSRGFFITFVNTDFNHNRLCRAKGTHHWDKGFFDFRFETIPEGLPPSTLDATQDPIELCYSIKNNCLPVFCDLLVKLRSNEELPAVTAVIADGVMSFAIEAGEKLGLPVVVFWTASACGFMGYLHMTHLIQRGIIPFQDEDYAKNGLLGTKIDWIPGMKDLCLKDMPSFIRTTNIDDILLNYLSDQVHNCLQSSAIIINTFEDLEHEVLSAMAPISPPIYSIGPLTLLSDKATDDPQLRSFNVSMWKEDRSCLEWLDKQEEKSVVYVNYGCVTLISNHHLEEFAWGLANSKHPFLWIVRPDIAMGKLAVLPDEFYEETEGRCILTSWCPQEEVLSHPAVAVFLSHCGWNSSLESIGRGVPMLCWPFFAEQQTNCRYICKEWGMGLEVDHEVERGEIERVVKEVMEGEKGKEMKDMALQWQRKANKAIGLGGTTYEDFDRLVNFILDVK